MKCKMTIRTDLLGPSCTTERFYALRGGVPTVAASAQILTALGFIVYIIHRIVRKLLMEDNRRNGLIPNRETNC